MPLRHAVHDVHDVPHRRSPAPLRPAGAALHLVSHRAAILMPASTSARCARRRARATAIRSRAAVAVRARAVLHEPVLLLRLQSHHHARQVARRSLPRAPVPRDRADGALFDRDREVDPAALRRRHAELPVAGRSCARSSTHCAAISASPDRDERDMSIELDPRFVDAGGHRGAGRHRLQPRQPRRAGFRSRRAGRGEPDPERGGDAAR